MTSSGNIGSNQLIFNSLLEVDFDALMQQRFPGARFLILTDEQVSSLWLEFLLTHFEVLNEAEVLEVPAGESSKSLAIAASLWEALSEYEIGRNDVLINLGGGVITDLGGFVASTYKRGMRFINIPTTLLAQVDASVGGKTGIDLGPLKNQVGTFAQPELVFVDSAFLQTLPTEQFISGLAEMLKHGLIADSEHWRELQSVSGNEIPQEYIQRSVSIKETLVLADPFERGDRKKLNFGHTVGHALEGHQLILEKPILHGHAIGLGMLAETYISFRKELLNESDFAEIETRLVSLFSPFCPEKVDADALLRLMRNDKKNQGTEIRMTLLKSIGNAVYDQTVEEQLIRESLGYLSKKLKD